MNEQTNTKRQTNRFIHVSNNSKWIVCLNKLIKSEINQYKTNYDIKIIKKECS